MNGEIEPLINLLTAKYGWVSAMIGWMGAARLAFKFFSGRLQGRLTGLMVEAASGPDEDERQDWQRVLRSHWYRGMRFGLDLVASVKLPGLEEFLRARGMADSKSQIANSK